MMFSSDSPPEDNEVSFSTACEENTTGEKAKELSSYNNLPDFN
jgi:hypothetical protein